MQKYILANLNTPQKETERIKLRASTALRVVPWRRRNHKSTQYLWGAPIKQQKELLILTDIPPGHDIPLALISSLLIELFAHILWRTELVQSWNATERTYERPIRTTKLWNPTGMSSCCPKAPLVCIYPPQTSYLRSESWPSPKTYTTSTCGLIKLP